jgi:glycosyltransferase involved in cell wall biosynthesis
MKIGIESQRIFRREKHGMDVVAIELIRELQNLDHNNQYILFAKDGPDKTCFRESENFTTHIVDGYTYADWEQLSLPRAVKKQQLSLLHCTANTAPFSGKIPLIVTVHDIIYLENGSFDGSPYQRFGNLYRRFVVPHIIRKASKIITVSEYEKRIIAEFSKTDPSKIEVIHNGVAERFHGGFSDEQLNTFRKRHQLPQNFILILGNTAPRKNTPRIVEAYAQYFLSSREPMPLVICDYKRSFVYSMLRKYNSTRILNNIITPGYIDSAEMPYLYNCASLFVYPSLRESFGLPVLEAMACGVPVLASDIPAIREVAGDSAFLVDPYSKDSIAHAIEEMLRDSDKRRSLKEKGPARASQFSWESSAKKLLSLYNEFG